VASAHWKTPAEVVKRNGIILVGTVLVTFVALRASLLIAPDSDLNVGGFNVHHLFTGLLLIVAGGVPLAVFRGHTRRLDVALIVFGVGLGMALDEWVYLIATDGSNAAYLLPVSWWGGVALVGLACVYALALVGARVRRARALALLILTLGAFAAVVGARGQEAPGRARVMVLGVYHFGNPNQDYVRTDVDDHLSERRQTEIREVLDLLAAFRPTKVALEAVPGSSPVPDRYQAYLRGEDTLRADERDQLGFRLARRFGLPRVYAVDQKLDMDVAGVVAAAEASGDSAFLRLFRQTIAEVQELEARKASLTVREILELANDPQALERQADLYLQIARVRGDGDFKGPDVLAAWYQRNFRIFSNLVRVVESPEDRVLVIFGAGHAPILRELVRSSPDLELVEPNDYLGRR
jgi:hypothetical protein